MSHRGPESGSATVDAVVVVGVLLSLLAGAAVLAGLLAAQRRAASAADLAALAAAQRLAAGASSRVPGPGACAGAARVAAANAARLRDCRVTGRDVLVRVAVPVPMPVVGEWDVPARARAGPAVPGPTVQGGADPADGPFAGAGTPDTDPAGP